MEFKRFCRFLFFFSLAVFCAAGLPFFGVTPVKPPKPAPSFQLPDLSQKSVRLEDFKGKAVLLNFWASWCGPCVEEMPALGKLYERYKEKDLVVIGVSSDSNMAPVRKAIERFQIPFLVLLDSSGAVTSRYGVRGLPTTMLINRNGEMVGKLQGARDWDSAAAHAWIDDLLGEKPSVSKPEKAKAITPAVLPPSETQSKISVSGPKGAVVIGKPFHLHVLVSWKGDLDSATFEPPQFELPQNLKLLSLTSNARATSQENILDYELELLPEKGKVAAGRISIGPFSSRFRDFRNQEGTLQSQAYEVQLVTSRFLQYFFWVFGTLTAVLLSGLAFTRISRRMQKSARCEEMKVDLNQMLSEAERLKANGTPVEFYEKLLEISATNSQMNLSGWLKPKLEAVRYGREMPEARQLEEDFRRLSQEIKAHPLSP